jgi:hypothetical protein
MIDDSREERTLAESAVVAMIGDHFEAIGQDEVRAGEAYADDAILEYVRPCR